MVPPPSSPKRSKPWLDDGDLVLSVAEVDGSCQYFRVHRAKIYSASPVLRDLIEQCAPKGRPAETMHEDLPCAMLALRAKHFSTVLQMVYDPSSLKVAPMNPDLPLIIDGPLKLATRYQITEVRTHLVALLESAWPRTRAQWDDRRYRVNAVRAAMLDAKGRLVGPTPDSVFPEPASAIRVARRNGVPRVLPAAYLALSHIVRGTYDYDGAFRETRAGPKLGLMTARWALLDGRDLLRIMDGRRRVADALEGMAVTVRLNGERAGTVIACADAACARARQIVAAVPGMILEGYVRHPNDEPLGMLNRDGISLLIERNKLALCAACRPELIENVHAYGDDLWERLPQIFGLEAEEPPSSA